MAQWRNNEFSYWMRDNAFTAWADEMKLEVTTAAPEFVWVDIETTGLDANQDVILELGIILTDGFGRVCKDSVIDWRVWRNGLGCTDNKSWTDAWKNMESVVRDMHTESGLDKEITQIRRRQGAHDADPLVVAEQSVDWLKHHTFKGKALQLSGSSPHFDRAFLKADMPDLEHWFHYRSGVDTSSIREVAKRINRPVAELQPMAMKKHRPVPDLVDTIRLYRYFLKNFLIRNETL